VLKADENIFLPDYEKSILGIPNSILAHYGAKPHHATLSVLDEKLSNNYKNVVLFVLDGMGIDALKVHAPDGFLMENCAAQISSIYPCTTTSALTTLETGLTPIEHSWLGWSMYFKEIDKCVDLYTGNESGTERPASDRSIAWEVIGTDDLYSQIVRANPSIECCRVSPFSEKYRTQTNEDVCNHIEMLCRKDGRKYIYAYHFQPDTDMHYNGCYCERTKANIVLFDKQIEQLAAKLTDTLLIVTADHGMVDVVDLVIDDFPEISECLAVPISREPRSLTFFIKPEFKGLFPERWERQFGHDYILMTASEVLEKGFFGSGIPHERARDFLGDYVAFATGDKALWYNDEKGEGKLFKACHAGLRHEEMIVPLIIIER